MKLNRKILLSAILLSSIAIALFTANLLFDSVYRLPILMYHSVEPESGSKIVVSPEAFERQIKFLRDRHYNVITLKEAVKYIQKRERPPKNTLAITFDDGYMNNYETAYPILKKYNIPATIFIIVNKVGKSGFMDWRQLKEMSDSGLIDIESHTMNHKWLNHSDDRAIRYEAEESRKILERKLGKGIDFLCYPMGGYDARVKVAAEEAGYKAAFATKPTGLAPNYDIYEIKRVRISPTSNNIFVFAIKTSGYHAFFRLVQNDYKNIPKVICEKSEY